MKSFAELNNSLPIIPIDQTITRVQIWGYNKGILQSNLGELGQYSVAMAQASKTIEEVAELVQALNTRNNPEIFDAYGDILVTLIMGMETLGISPAAALEHVYNIISKRTGAMKDGVFIKDEA